MKNRQHYYKNYEHVIFVLTNQYGFTYKGVGGENAEECFEKDSSTPEKIFIHPMHCHYFMSESRQILAKQTDHFNCNTDPKNEDEQLAAFNKLLAVLDKFTVKNNSPKTVVPTFPEAMDFNEHLWPLFREKYAEGKLPLHSCLSLLGITYDEYKKMIKSD